MTLRHLSLRGRVFWRGERGSAAVEYALILAAITAVVMVGIGAVGQSMHGSLSLLGGAAWKSSATTELPSETGSPRADAAEVNNAANGPATYSTETVLLLMLGMLTVIFYACSLRNKLRQQREFHTPALTAEIQAIVEHKKFNKRQQILMNLSEDLDALFLSHMQVRQLMTQPVNFVLPHTTVKCLRRIMKEEHVRHYAVCDKERHLLGVVSDRDVLRGEGKYVVDIMTGNPVTVESDCAVNPAITLMINRGISCLLIVDGAKLVGMLTTTDLVMTLQCALQMMDKNEGKLLALLEKAETNAKRMAELPAAEHGHVKGVVAALSVTPACVL